MKTNKTIEIFRRERDWSGEESLTSLGNFNVYLEEHYTKDKHYASGGRDSAPLDIVQESKGFFIIFDELDLKNASIKYDEKTYVVGWIDTYFDMKNRFHHTEAMFK